MTSTTAITGRKSVGTLKSPSKDAFIKFRVTSAEKVFLKEVAAKNHMTLAQLIRTAIENY